MLNEHQQALVDSIFNALWREAMNGPLAGHNEGFLKVVAMRSLLATGCSLSEGGTATDKLLSLVDGKLAIEPFRRPRISARAGVKKLWTSADLTIEKPVRLVVEFQVRSAASTQDAVFSDNLYDDIERVRARRADAFFFLCDYGLWLRLRGEKPVEGKRLKPSKHSAYFRSVLPDLWDEQKEASSVALDGEVFADAAILRTPHGEESVLMSLVHAGDTSAPIAR